MTVRSACVSAILLIVLHMASAQTGAGDLAFGQVYGSAGFLSPDPSGSMTNAPNVVLVFTAANAHRNLVLTQPTGDYIALLEPGSYCLAAYTREGRGMQLASNQLKCISVVASTDARLDVMLLRNQK